MLYSFEKLRVWQHARILTKDIYKVTAQFPREELFGLTNQIRRAAVSIGSNIAEGSGRFSKKEKIRFFSIAYGSLLEVLSQLITSNDLNYIDGETLLNLRGKIEEISKMLSGLKNGIEK